MSAVFKRELRSLFTSPVAYVVLAILFAIGGYFFYLANMESGFRSLSYVFNYLYSYACFLVLPILTMRLFSEEKRQKTDQALLTAPVSLTGIVLGKFFAALLVYVVGVSITLVFGCVIATVASPSWLTIFGNYLGLVLYGGMIIAAGLLFSCLTESQLIAALVTFAFELILSSVNYLKTVFANNSLVSSVVEFLSVSERYNNFTGGAIRYDDVVFFLTMQAVFLFLAVRALDRKRWN
ncbi:MAG: ABC transporter permease subunit [Clostridia bacterium]|nr:ABC transporter permease subunit [Clostridia bacterium]